MLSPIFSDHTRIARQQHGQKQGKEAQRKKGDSTISNSIVSVK